MDRRSTIPTLVHTWWNQISHTMDHGYIPYDTYLNTNIGWLDQFKIKFYCITLYYIVLIFCLIRNYDHLLLFMYRESKVRIRKSLSALCILTVQWTPKREWIEMDLDFQKYWVTNVKMNAFQSWMHFYSFTGIAWSISLYAFQSKNNISFFCAQLWILFNSKFWIGNAGFQFNCIQLNLIESNWI